MGQFYRSKTTSPNGDAAAADLQGWDFRSVISDSKLLQKSIMFQSNYILPFLQDKSTPS
jgi:hypothetical protein